MFTTSVTSVITSVLVVTSLFHHCAIEGRSPFSPIFANLETSCNLTLQSDPSSNTTWKTLCWRRSFGLLHRQLENTFLKCLKHLKELNFEGTVVSRGNGRGRDDPRRKTKPF